MMASTQVLRGVDGRLKYAAWASVLVVSSALAFDTVGTESGTGTTQASACKNARNTAESRAQLSAQIKGPYSKVKPIIGACQCSETRSGLYACIVSWRVE